MASEHTSDIQKKIYQFIVEYMREEGMPPTNREIGSSMKIASTGHVDYHLSMLEKKGFITRESKKSRGIKLVQQPYGVPVMGSIAAGEPLDIFTDSSETLDVGHDLEQQVFLRVSGIKSGRYRARLWQSSVNAALLNLFEKHQA